MQTAPEAPTRAISPEIAIQAASALKALADPHRLRMLSFIGATPEGEVCVCDLTELTGLSQPTVSHHLKVMRDVGILQSERRGTWVWYAISPTFEAATTGLLSTFVPAVLAGGGDSTGMTGLRDVDSALSNVASLLADRHPEVEPDLVLAIVRESYAGLARTAKISSHLVPLTERFARQRLADITRDRTSTPPQVLYVCVANAGRSQIAAALTAKYAGDRVTVRSAGSTPAADVHTNVREALSAIGATAPAFPKPLTDDAVRAADVVVTMGCGDVCPIIPGVEYRDWAVGDPALASPDGVAAIRDDIDSRVRELVHELVPDLVIPDRH